MNNRERITSYLSNDISKIIDDKNDVKKAELKSLKTLPPSLSLRNDYDVLVLSGGGKKGIVQLGFLHNMYTNRLIDFNEIRAYIGTSVGSIICFLLIINYLPVEILTHVCSQNMTSNLQLNFLDLLTNFGVYTSDTVFDIIRRITEEKIGFIPTMYELYELFNKHFICVSHNLSADVSKNEQETVYIDYITHPNLSCIEALRMSSNIPLVFGKYIYDNNYYVDGAMTDNYAIAYAHSKFTDKKILGISVDNPTNNINDNKKINIIDYMRSLVAIPYRMNNAKSCKFTANNVHSILITIDEGNGCRFDVSPSQSFQLFSIGYKCASTLLQSNIKKKKEKID